MKRTWLLFSQAVTILVAAYFVVATLQPDWLRRGAVRSNAGIALLEAPATPVGEVSPGSFAPAAKKEIGRASCRERGKISVVAVSLKKKKKENKESGQR